MIEKSHPLVSVIVPSYNHEKYVKQTIESIIKQTYKNIELIVIDDGSKDKSSEILQKLSIKYGFYFEQQQNIGLPATLNKMIKMAKGKYISLIASDDIKTLDKVELLVNEFEQLSDDYAVVCGNAKFIDDSGKKICLEIDKDTYCDFIDRYARIREGFDIENDFGSYGTLLQNNYLPAMSTLISKKALYKVGLYDEKISIEDWSMWLKLAQTYKIKYIDKIVAYYRWHDNNSIKIMTSQLIFDTLKIFEREKKYCFANGYKALWEQKYYSAILYYLTSKQYLTFYKVVNMKNIFGFFNFVMQKIIDRTFKNKQ